jgi:hypothetical protein
LNKTRPLSVIAAIGLLCCALPALATPTFCDSVSGNLVKNCGFETGDLTNWTRTEAVHDTIVAIVIFPHSGNIDAAFNSTNGATNFLDQTLATVPGESYTFSFFDLGEFDRNGQFSVFWNGVNILTAAEQSSTYLFHTFTEMATAASTVIRFAENTSGAYLLDDVVVTQNPSPVPEPSTSALAVTALCILVLLNRRRVF